MKRILYHATYGPLMEKIQKEGLRLPEGKSNWDMYAGEYIYLAANPYIAESYAETADYVPDEWINDIVTLEVTVDTNDVQRDPNTRCAKEEGYSFVVAKPIPANQIKIWGKEN